MLAFPLSVITSEVRKLNEEFQLKAIPHLDELYDFAYRVTGSSSNAGALLIETFRGAYWFWAKLDERIGCKAWLFRIMRNTYTSIYWKKTKKSGEVNYEDILKLYESLKPSSTGDYILKIENYNLPENELTKIISTLPYDFRIVIILKDILGHSYDDIADFVDVPIGTVRSRLYRARKMLFVRLKKYAADNDNLNNPETKI
ncbi:MAG: sigma-70 family RNA polymerase sigma factor [Ignavibacterium sp.]|jgi:RNA polymerase sigma-70 factor (ECF subfamily)|nr:sigma-70 family RNA polymerase sigma factor [Ignavibacterium sp.]MDX9711173.1 sigma-70 family RNA polymerase sigma factor [Ignavibacteriaceae bacterium]GIK20849.1 MAG: RNA polymerase sigma factor RpoE [Ignavibacteriota bacterium]